MQQDFLLSIADAEKLINGFNNCNLPKEEWTHEAHLISGLWMLSRYDDGALDEMRTRIRRFNESVGGVNDDQNGYHETLTVFWLCSQTRTASCTGTKTASTTSFSMKRWPTATSGRSFIPRNL
jgi:hypothetical protein